MEPSYSAVNNDFMHVDPHITQYTVYITDNYIIVKENVTETQFSPTSQQDMICVPHVKSQLGMLVVRVN